MNFNTALSFYFVISEEANCWHIQRRVCICIWFGFCWIDSGLNVKLNSQLPNTELFCWEIYTFLKGEESKCSYPLKVRRLGKQWIDNFSTFYINKTYFLQFMMGILFERDFATSPQAFPRWQSNVSPTRLCHLWIQADGRRKSQDQETVLGFSNLLYLCLLKIEGPLKSQIKQFNISLKNE